MKIIIALAAALAMAANAAAQSYPSRPITLVVGFAPGGGTDTVARVMQRKLGEYLGQTIVVENRAGAGGIIAADLVSKAAPDGYTILLATIAALAVAPHLNSKLPYNPLRDFAPISMATVSGNVLVVNSSVQAKTLAEYVKEANSKPGGMAYGTSGRASERFAPVDPSARSLPDLTCGVAVVAEANTEGICPPSRSLIAGPPPL